MTVMFCDLIGSSGLAAMLDPEEYAALLVAYRERCSVVVARHGGYVSRYEGDGVLACFGYPRAVGRDAQVAVACALDLAREVEDFARQTNLAGGRKLALRIGIETGLVLAGRLDPEGQMALDGLVGAALNTAARLQHLAAPNGIVIGEATRELVGEDFALEEIPASRLASLAPYAGRAFVVGGERTHEERRLTFASRRKPLVGRAAELDALVACWERTVEGDGQAVLLSGEPGVGKSRLVQELLDRTTHASHALVLLACTPQSAATPLHPVIAALRGSAADAVGLAAAIRGAGLASGPAPAVLAEALGLGPGPSDLAASARRRILMDALQAWLLSHAALRPLIVVAEDLHWADPSFLELLQGLTDLLRGRRVMLLATYRNDFVLPWADRPNTRRMALPSLRAAEAEQLLGTLLRDAAPATREAILSRADGVPLFLEEFALAAQNTAVPRTLQQLFTARLDALGEAKSLAQCASVLGREVDHDVLAALVGLPEPQLERRLAQLATAEVLVRTGLSPTPTYTFRHALLQEAARASLPHSERRPLHARAAALLAKLRPELAEGRPELLAEHHAQAGEAAAAAPLFTKAARRTLAAGALQETEALLRRGLDVAAALPAVEASEVVIELELLSGLVSIARQGPGSHAVREAYERALHAAEAVPGKARILPPLRGLTSFYQVRGPLSRAGQLCDRLVAAAEGAGDTCMLVDAWRRRGWNRCCAGRFAEAEADLTRALDAFDPARCGEHMAVASDDPRVLALANLCWLDLPRHGSAAAARRAEAAAAAARESSHPLSACYGLVFAAYAFQAAGRWDEASELTEIALAIAAEKGFAYWTALGWVALGHDRAARRGEPVAGRDLILRGLAGYRDTQGELLQPFILSVLAEAQAALGDGEAAEAAVTEAIGVAQRLEAHGFLPDLMLRRARLLSGPARRMERLGPLTRALEMAAATGAVAVECAVVEEMNAVDRAYGT